MVIYKLTVNVLVASSIVLAGKGGKANKPNYKLTFQWENDFKSGVFLTNVNDRVFGDKLKFHAWHLSLCSVGTEQEYKIPHKTSFYVMQPAKS